jgi:Asp-tRNA(Asn)/Glu-tRNA(Gln) amidotransferase A subunit family amidase
VHADLAFAGPAALAERVRSREATPRELVELFLARIEALDPRLNAFRTVMADQALAEADGVGNHDGALAGVPIAIKDDLAVAGQVATRGMRAVNWPRPAAADAEPVRLLRAAGAIPIGITNVPELMIFPWMPAPPFEGSYRAAAASPPRRLRIAVSPRLPPGLVARVAADERSAWERTAATLADAGHDVSARDPDYGLAQMLFAQFWVRGIHEDVSALADPSQLERSTRQMAAAGRTVVPDRRRDSLLRARERAATRILALWDEFDVLMTPGLVRTPIAADGGYGRSAPVAVNTAGRFSPFTAIFNLTGQPAVAVPAGWSADGLPLSVQLVGRLGAEDVLYSLAAQLESAAPWADRRPPGF